MFSNELAVLNAAVPLLRMPSSDSTFLRQSDLEDGTIEQILEDHNPGERPDILRQIASESEHEVQPVMDIVALIAGLVERFLDKLYGDVIGLPLVRRCFWTGQHVALGSRIPLRHHGSLQVCHSQLQLL